MRGRIVTLIASIVVLLTASPARSTEEGSQLATTEAFADAMVRGVGARKTTCPEDVAEPVRSQGLKAMCARYEGGFARFALRWDFEISRQGGHENAAGRSNVEAETDWEENGPWLDRIYRVGNGVLGVRYRSGDLLMVW